jgi:hypothetical protein
MRLVKKILEERVEGADASVPVLLVIEELNRLMRDKLIVKEVKEILEAIGEEGRGFNVFVIIGGQKITGLADIRKSIISFIVHRCDETEAQLCIPHRYAKFVPELANGQCYVKDADGMTEPGLQVLTTLQDVEQAAARLPVVNLPQQKKLRLPAQEPAKPARPTVPIRPRPTQDLQQRKQQPVPQEPQQQFSNTYPRQQFHKNRLTAPETDELAPQYHVSSTWGEEVVDEELVTALFDASPSANAQAPQPPQKQTYPTDTDELVSPDPELPAPQNTAENNFSALIRMRQQDKKKS